jgi:hypothetical protein
MLILYCHELSCNQYCNVNVMSAEYRLSLQMVFRVTCACVCVCVCVSAEPQFSFPCSFVLITAVTWRSVGEDCCMLWER